MGSLKDSDLENYEVMQLTLNCLSGVDRKMTVPTDVLKRALAGTETITFGGGTVPASSFIYDARSSLGVVKIDPATIRPMPWVSCHGQKVGGAMCEIAPPLDQPEVEISPRAVAKRQVARLKEKFGLTIKSAYEAEFMIFEKDVETPFNKVDFQPYGRSDNMAGQEQTLLGACQSLEEAGLPLESFLTEFAAAQFELTLRPQEGVASADSIMLMKDGFRVCLGHNGMVPTFMACPHGEGHANGFHLNHSLWTADGTNAFADLNDPMRTSKLARHWLAGLVQHAEALTALLCPTFNCYIRLKDELSPTNATWAEEDRSTFVRLKTDKNNVYLENRLPSSACNPYLALAGTLAAGMDGLTRQLECPPPNDPNAPPIPKTLEASVAALKQDRILTEALGQDCVEAYLSMDERAINSKVEFNLEDLETQRHIYFHHI